MEISKEENLENLENQFNEQKLRYQVRELTEEENANRNFCKYRQQLVFNELNEINEFYLLLHPNLKSKPLYDYSTSNILSSRCCVEYTEGIDYNITPSFVNQFVHYKTFKYVLSRILKINEQLSGNVVLYDKPILPIIDKPEPIDLEKLVRPNRFPCNYNESDFSKYIKNGHNLTQINTPRRFASSLALTVSETNLDVSPTWSGFV